MSDTSNSDILNVNLPYIRNRFYQSGEISKGVHLVDLYMYNSSLFANSLIVEDKKFTVIIDTGTSESVNAIINYIEFHSINIKHVLIIPTHHHFDHIGGITRLIEYLRERRSDIKILSSKKMASWLINPEYIVKMAKKSFEPIVGELKPVDISSVRYYEPDKYYEIGPEWSFKILETPGHTDDHISPVFKNSLDQKIIFFGEALGINLQGKLFPIPASSAPDFNSRKYLASIEKIRNERPDLGIFSHVGGIVQNENIEKTCDNAIYSYKVFREDILHLYEENHSTRYIVNELFNIYKNLIGTRTIDVNLAKNLAFTIVYGILQDEGLK